MPSSIVKISLTTDPLLSSFFLFSFFYIQQWCFAWTPYCVVSLIGIFGYADNITPLTSMIPAIMAKMAACVDPYLYAVTHPRFRSELEKIFCSARIESGSNFQTSYYSRGASRRNKRNGSECESIEVENYNNNNNNSGGERPPLNRAESSFCDESTVSLEVEIKC